MRKQTLSKKARYMRAKYRRIKRLVFCSPAEARFVRVMGGIVLTAGWLRSRQTGFPATIILSLGPVLRGERVRREVQVGRYWLDFGNDIKRAIEIDGEQWHLDIVKEQTRSEYLSDKGWLVLHIKAKAVFNQPLAVRSVAESWLINGTYPTRAYQQSYAIDLKKTY